MEDDSGECGSGQRYEADDDSEQARASRFFGSPKMAMAIAKVFIAYASDVKVRGSQSDAAIQGDAMVITPSPLTTRATRSGAR